MKALSIWQPWASLFMSEHKKIETRSWPAPYSIRGQRIAIASTKTIRPEQRKPVSEDAFRVHYAATGLADLQKLPMGCVLGSVTVVGCKEIDSELLLELNEQEEAFGIYGPGRFAWLLADPEPLDRPVVVRGGQGALELVSRVTMTPEGNFLPFFGYLASVLRVRTSLTPPLNFRRSLFHPNQGLKNPQHLLAFWREAPDCRNPVTCEISGRRQWGWALTSASDFATIDECGRCVERPAPHSYMS